MSYSDSASMPTLITCTIVLALLQACTKTENEETQTFPVVSAKARPTTSAGSEDLIADSLSEYLYLGNSLTLPGHYILSRTVREPTSGEGEVSHYESGGLHVDELAFENTVETSVQYWVDCAVLTTELEQAATILARESQALSLRIEIDPSCEATISPIGMEAGERGTVGFQQDGQTTKVMWAVSTTAEDDMHFVYSGLPAAAAGSLRLTFTDFIARDIAAVMLVEVVDKAGRIGCIKSQDGRVVIVPVR